jgi:hypothetical protein
MAQVATTASSSLSSLAIVPTTAIGTAPGRFIHYSLVVNVRVAIFVDDV